MRSKKFKLLALPLALSGALLAFGATANVQSQVNEMFGSMINVTAPGAYESASRGVVVGGNLVLRNRISTVNLVHFTPPSAKGGCGGINMYMGSFSFINADEFVSLLRNVASNAVGVASGFAFKMALNAMDSMTGGVITELQDKMQALNQAMLNSCQLATGIIDNTREAFDKGRDLKSSFTAVGKGVTTDFFGASRATAQSPAERITSAGAAEICSDVGNVLWCALKKTNIASQTVFGSDQNAEFIMSMTGSYLVQGTPDNDGGTNFEAQPLPPLPDINLRLFIEGSNGESVNIYRCSDEDCLNPSITVSTPFVGLTQRIMDTVRSSDLFERIDSGLGVSTAEKIQLGWLFATPIGVNTQSLIRTAGPQTAYNYLEKHSAAIAIEAAYSMLNQQFAIARGAIGTLDMADAQKTLEDIRHTQTSLAREALMLKNELSGDPTKDYNELIKQHAPADSGGLPQGTKN